MAVEDIAIDGVTLRVESVGHRGPPLLLVHGHPFDRSMWQPQLDAFEAAGRRAIAPDLRGYGESSAVSGKTTLDIFARDLAALLDALGLDECVICGLSWAARSPWSFVVFSHRAWPASRSPRPFRARRAKAAAASAI